MNFALCHLYGTQNFKIACRFFKICACLLQAALLHDKVHHFATVSKFILPLNYQCLDTPFYVQILILIFTCLLCSIWITN